MQIITYRHHGAVCVGAWLAATQRIAPLSSADGKAASTLLQIIEAGATYHAATHAASHLRLDQVEALAPIPLPARNIFCVGKNYANHAREFAGSGFDAGHAAADALPAYPIVFTKVPQTVIANGASIWPAEGVTTSLDYEAELAVIIGRGGRGIGKAEAMQHVWGYTIINDVTARDWQQRHQQWLLGKSFDTFAPMGPVAVSADEIDGANLDIKCWVNDELRQHANTRELLFDIPTLIETISAGVTLQPGDIIATGTPEGVGAGQKPPRFLQRGDRVSIEIEGIGRLENPVG